MGMRAVSHTLTSCPFFRDHLNLGSVPVPQAGLLGPVVVAPQVAPAHQAGAVSADELHGWHERGAPAAVHAQQICCRAQHHHRDGGRHSTAMPSAAPHQAAASGRPSLRSSNQAPRLRRGAEGAGRMLPQRLAADRPRAASQAERERDQNSRHGLDEAARRQEHEQRRHRDEGEGGEAAPCHRRCRGSRWLARV